jgi:hypothetical protein
MTQAPPVDLTPMAGRSRGMRGAPAVPGRTALRGQTRLTALLNT